MTFDPYNPHADGPPEPDDECEECDGTGHREDCEHRDTAWDIGDLICRAPCDGCCPNGCALTGLAAEEHAAEAKARRLL
jgi:hypothetical protein